MLNKYFTLIIFIFCFKSFSQKISRQLKSDLKLVTNLKTAKDFIKKNPDIKSKVFTYNELKHNNKISKSLFNKNIGDIYQLDEQIAQVYYKILSITSKLHYRASYIFFDGNKIKKTVVDSLTNVIYFKLNTGENFNKLAGEYSMSRNANIGGDLGWFTKEKMPKSFIDSLKVKKEKSVYNFNLNNTNKYYIVKKTETEKEIRILQVLKISFDVEKKKRLINIIN
jgi:hypothetical protein